MTSTTPKDRSLRRHAAGNRATRGALPLLPVFRRVMAETWRGTAGWAVGIAASLLLYLPLYPSIGGEEMADLIASLPPAMINTFGFDDIATGAGYAQSTFYGLIGFVLLTIACCGWGATAIAGAEESGRLEMTLAHGVGRVQYALETATAIIVRLAVLVVWASVLVLLLNSPSQLHLEPAHIWAGGLALFALTLLSATVALAAGALSGRRSVGVGAGAAIAVVGYVMNAVGNQGEDLGWLHDFSPYDWAFAHDPLAQGISGGGMLLLAACNLAALAVGVFALNRRDIAT